MKRSVVELTPHRDSISIYAPRLLNVGLLGVFCWMLAQWTWVVVAPSAVPAPPAASPTTEPTAALKTILASRFFSSDGGNASVEVGAATTLDLKLVAVASSAAGRAPSFAVLSVGGKPNEVFRDGREITAGVVLYRIAKDHVVIRRHGVLERVEFPDVKRVGGAASSFNLNVQQQGAGQYSFSRDSLNRSLQDPAQLSQLGALSVVPGAGVIIGDAPSGSFAQKLSLQPGDVIRIVNGEAVTSQDDLMRLYQKFTSTGQITLEGVRKGAPLKLTYTVNP